MSITRSQAEREALKYVERLAAESGEEWVLLPDLTRELRRGWVFFYETAAYAKSGDPLHGGVGNAPLIIDRDSGEIYVTGSAYPIEHYISLFENGGKLSRALP